MNVKNILAIIFLFISLNSFSNPVDDSETRSNAQEITVKIVNYTSEIMTLHSENIEWGEWVLHPGKTINVLADTSMTIVGKIFSGPSATVVYDIKGVDNKNYRLSVTPTAAHFSPTEARVDYCLYSVEPPRICALKIGGMQPHRSDHTSSPDGEKHTFTLYLKRVEGELKITDGCTKDTLSTGKNRYVDLLTTMSEVITPQTYTHDFLLKKDGSGDNTFKVSHVSEESTLDLLTTAYHLGMVIDTCRMTKGSASEEQEQLVIFRR